MTTSSKRALPLREQEKLNKSHRIRAAAESLFSEKPFSQVTTKELAERARVGEATLFRYMASKTELLLTVYGDKMERVLEQIELEDARLVAECKCEDTAFFLGRVYAIYEARSRFFREDPENGALYLREAFETGSDPGGRSVSQGDRCIDLATSILQDGQQASVLIGSTDMRLVAQNCHGIFIHEVDRTPVRGFTPESIGDRVKRRLEVQLEPLSIVSH